MLKYKLTRPGRKLFYALLVLLPAIFIEYQAAKLLINDFSLCTTIEVIFFIVVMFAILFIVWLLLTFIKHVP